MPQEKSVSDAFAYGQMIDSLCRYGRHHGASRIVYMMMKRRCSPSLVSYNSIVHGHAKNGGYLRAYQFLKQGFEIGYSPSETTYKVLIECLSLEENDLGKAKKLFDIMLNKEGIKCHPDVVTLNTVINGFCKMGKVEEGIQIEEAKVSWDDIFWPSGVHDHFVYSAIIKGLCCLPKFDEACDFLYELVDCGIRPNTVNYNILIEGACKLDLKKEAYQIVGETRKNGVAPDAVTWRVIDKLHKETKQWGPEDKINM
ncbi:pentatricopeptide repeat-containing protein At3g18020-like [Cynara cardunculus var. scolymus]|uniref:pentatricopeptide repeat-containing protein At3g18020-like n=1 Tax=Cynara cardunculus var. scolymus TaxID=59895 RepID=UPI000D624D6C|nr:pentatricopeptide repeat-containing protein At3g18020-like [Cynara cardunculus var. scolymus]